MARHLTRSTTCVLAVTCLVLVLGCHDDSLPSGPGGITEGKVLPVPFVKHYISEWSWAAASSMVLVYYSGASVPQCEVASVRARMVEPGANCCGAPVEACYDLPPPTASEIVQVLEAGVAVGGVSGDFGDTGDTDGDGDTDEDDTDPFLDPQTLSFSASSAGVLSQEDVYASINAGRPILMRLEGIDPPFSYAVIYGYYADGDLYIHDTAAGPVRAAYGSTFNYGGPNELTWVESVLISGS